MDKDTRFQRLESSLKAASFIPLPEGGASHLPSAAFLIRREVAYSIQLAIESVQFEIRIIKRLLSTLKLPPQYVQSSPQQQTPEQHE